MLRNAPITKIAAGEQQRAVVPAPIPQRPQHRRDIGQSAGVPQRRMERSVVHVLVGRGASSGALFGQASPKRLNEPVDVPSERLGRAQPLQRDDDEITLANLGGVGAATVTALCRAPR